MSHTPAPWAVSRILTKPMHTIRISIYSKATNKNVCKIPADYRFQENKDANAHLIAAAPELLEACKKTDKMFDYLDKEITGLDLKMTHEQIAELKIARLAIRQAIAKAEGK